VSECGLVALHTLIGVKKGVAEALFVNDYVRNAAELLAAVDETTSRTSASSSSSSVSATVVYPAAKKASLMNLLCALLRHGHTLANPDALLAAAGALEDSPDARVADRATLLVKELLRQQKRGSASLTAFRLKQSEDESVLRQTQHSLDETLRKQEAERQAKEQALRQQETLRLQISALEARLKEQETQISRYSTSSIPSFSCSSPSSPCSCVVKITNFHFRSREQSHYAISGNKITKVSANCYQIFLIDHAISQVCFSHLTLFASPSSSSAFPTRFLFRNRQGIVQWFDAFLCFLFADVFLTTAN
jgi:hypothetical protein